MTLQAVHTAYDSTQFADNFPPGIERHFWFQARNQIVAHALRDAVRGRLLPPGPQILEVGCGTGIVVADLRKLGLKVTGVEVGRPVTLPSARDFIVAGLLAHDLPASTRDNVDALLFLDVIEHVPDDVALLRDTVAAFPKCCYVLITVPARPEVWSRHDTHYGHYRRYTRSSLRSSLQAAGLESLNVRYMFQGLYAAAGLMKLVRRDRDPVMQAPRQPKLHDLLAAGLRLEHAILGGSALPGLSLLAAARVRPSRA